MVLKYHDYTNIDCLKPFPSQQKQLQAENKEGFYLAKNVDIHAIRRAQMIAKYPQILDLYGTNIWVGIGVTVTTICQIALAAMVCDASWPVFLFCAYGLTATGMASVQLGLHEICHNAASPYDWVNRVFELILNLPLLIPFAATYKVFHLDHHRYQGVDQVDTDLPTEAEAKFWCNKSYPYPVQCLMKCGFLATNLVAYGLRPVSQRPENVAKVRLTVPYILNHVFQVVFTYAMYHFFGINSVLYLFTGLLLSGVHPTAGHFLAEHYPFENTLEKYQLDAPIETYSYYGIFNYVLYNGGYHIEHHDFLKIPFHNLPKLRQIAPEFYPPEMEVKSYTMVLLNFIFNPKVSLWSRVKRPSYGHQVVYPSQQLIDFKAQCVAQDEKDPGNWLGNFNHGTLLEQQQQQQQKNAHAVTAAVCESEDDNNNHMIQPNTTMHPDESIDRHNKVMSRLQPRTALAEVCR